MGRSGRLPRRHHRPLRACQGGITDPFRAQRNLLINEYDETGELARFRGEPIAKLTGVLYIIHITILVP
jgi:hypothetical protein